MRGGCAPQPSPLFFHFKPCEFARAACRQRTFLSFMKSFQEPIIRPAPVSHANLPSMDLPSISLSMSILFANWRLPPPNPLSFLFEAIQSWLKEWRALNGHSFKQPVWEECVGNCGGHPPFGFFAMQACFPERRAITSRLLLSETESRTSTARRQP